MSIIVGLDAGITNTGWAVYDTSASKLIAAGTIVATHEHIHDKLVYIDQQLAALLEHHKPAVFAYEHPVFIGRGKNNQNINLALGVVLLNVHKRAIPIYAYTAPCIKREVTEGNAKADKKEVEKAIGKWLGVNYRYNSNHASDAASVILCYLKKEGIYAARS